jgi:hypothetical protein
MLTLPKSLLPVGCNLLSFAGVRNLVMTRAQVRRLSCWTFNNANSLREVLFPRVLERLSDCTWNNSISLLVICVDRLKRGGDGLTEANGLRRLCLAGAGWWVKGSSYAQAMIFSGCAGAAGRLLARPLLAAA